VVSGVSWLNPLTWPIEPWVLLGVEAIAVLYLWGGTRVRPNRKNLGAARLRAAAFWSGLAVIVFALNTPLETLARQLFWAHMTQHLLLIMVAAPLLVAAAPWLQAWRGLPLRVRRPLARTAFKHPALATGRWLIAWLSAPLGALLLSSGNLWFWHWPQAYDLTLRNHAIHHLEHALFLGLGILFWAQLIDQPPFHSRLTQLQRVAYVFVATIQAWALAALLAFATVPYYAYALLPSRPGAISALTDQQCGAGILWVPGSITYSIVFIVCIYLWFRDEDRAAQSFMRRPVEVTAK
jgi:cytochrome c oxidase assembly factor CtaG